MVQITIDGKPYQVQEGRNLVHVAREANIFIPSLCYYEHIHPPLGTCRVCTCLVNGKPTAGCTVLTKEGLEVTIETPDLVDLRKSLVEMLFAEGNHFCPACEKSGDCDLQHMAYELEVTQSRFPHLFKDHIIDYNPKRLVIEHNRCVLCRRCVEEVVTGDGRQVFFFQKRGNETRVEVDLELEATLTAEQAENAMHICPVGAILLRGRSMTRPFGHRRFDAESMQKSYSEREIIPFLKKSDKKKVIATTSLAGCFGCHMSMLDIDLEILDLIELVEFNKSPLDDIKTFTKHCDLGIIEGGCCNMDNIEVLKEFRKNCDILVALGECAIWGGLPAMRNTVPLSECLEEAYFDSMTSENGANLAPYQEDIPKILNKVLGCNEVVKIDYYIPGCPPDANHIWKVVMNILFGTNYSVHYSEFKYD